MRPARLFTAWSCAWSTPMNLMFGLAWAAAIAAATALGLATALAAAAGLAAGLATASALGLAAGLAAAGLAGAVVAAAGGLVGAGAAAGWQADSNMATEHTPAAAVRTREVSNNLGLPKWKWTGSERQYIRKWLRASRAVVCWRPLVTLVTQSLRAAMSGSRRA